ncbi:carboxylating nicotinate-nucleotide diphosphorylase [Paradesulfitobacterium ferrireducens]|uniref:carboxylating nicotinate-nucleotide diphosphorylase n=1 Tax=Paradesulfitobacterium ferrireducens TaxID=2816476 RepID=UPI001A8D3569|nr:carboxylating nicotinate-nucleotide diphosphorylase [Paradesulfitobacterium ferrireducens]
MNRLLWEESVRAALNEDIGFQDITTESIVDEAHQSQAEIMAKQEGIIAGLEVAETVFRLLNPGVVFSTKVKDGDKVNPGQIIATVYGPTRTLLAGERTALNFLQHLSGIATATARAVELVRRHACRIVDTRKTTPGLRMLEKYAIRVGGGHNHRLGLYDAVLIKDNHIEAAGGITQAVAKVREHVGHMVKIEVEVESLEQVAEALETKAEVIMLDNMPPDLMAQAVKLIDGKAMTEASGGITFDNLLSVAKSGVDIISLGWLTHSAPVLDISMNIVEEGLSRLWD